MHIIGLSIVIQVLCAVHCARNSRNNIWLMVIIFLSVPGCVAYALFEVAPRHLGHRRVRAAKAAAMLKLDPERNVRAAREALDVADTASNCIALGDALVEVGRHREAIEHYWIAIEKMPRQDRATQVKLARALLAVGDFREARRLLETLPHSHSPSENDRGVLLLAQALQESGDTEKALELFQDVGQRLPGGEAQCRAAGLLLQLGRPAEAQSVLEEVERLLKQIDRHERNQNKDMYDWAMASLGELRGPNAVLARSA